VDRLADHGARSVCRLLVTANPDPSAPILLTLMMEALLTFETSVLTRATRRNIPEDGIIYVISHLNFMSEKNTNEINVNFII
jgi:hypothetical protein